MKDGVLKQDAAHVTRTYGRGYLLPNCFECFRVIIFSKVLSSKIIGKYYFFLRNCRLSWLLVFVCAHEASSNMAVRWKCAAQDAN